MLDRSHTHTHNHTKQMQQGTLLYALLTDVTGKVLLELSLQADHTTLPGADSAIYRSIKWAKWQRAAVTMTQEDKKKWSTWREKRKREREREKGKELTGNKRRRRKMQKAQLNEPVLIMWTPCGRCRGSSRSHNKAAHEESLQILFLLHSQRALSLHSV